MSGSLDRISSPGSSGLTAHETQSHDSDLSTVLVLAGEYASPRTGLPAGHTFGLGAEVER